MGPAYEVKQAPDILWVLSPHIDLDLVCMPTVSDDYIVWNWRDNRAEVFLSCQGFPQAFAEDVSVNGVSMSMADECLQVLNGMRGAGGFFHLLE
jgi:hypothetical protein